MAAALALLGGLPALAMGPARATLAMEGATYATPPAASLTAGALAVQFGRPATDNLLGLAIVAFALAGLVGVSILRREPNRSVPLFAVQAPGTPRPAPPPRPTLPSPADLRRLHDTLPVGVALLDQEGRFLSVNARFIGLSGRSGEALLLHHLQDVLPEELAAPIEGARREVLATGRPVIERPILIAAAGPGQAERHLLASAHPVPDDAGWLGSVSLVLQDVTDRVRGERMRELLVRELNHRVKNTLATVQSITIATLRQADADPRSLSAALVARLMALARAHDLLTAHAWEPAEVSEVARVALGPWIEGMAGRLALDGPTGILLRPKQAQALVLALHELATNAVKHGALSNETGWISLRWWCEAATGRTTLDWRESGGPPVTEPPRERRGFGTRLLERALGSDLGSGSEVRLVFAPSGLEALLTFGETTPASPAPEAAPPDPLEARQASAPRASRPLPATP